MMGRLLGDIRYAWRGLLQAPGFSSIAILTLALGIGANTAIFSVANALLLRPLPYPDPDCLMIVTNAHGENRRPFSHVRAEFLRDHARSFEGFAPFVTENFNMTGQGDPEQLPAARVSWNFFQVLGVRPGLGRTFRADEDRPGARPEVLISDSLWKRRFGADPRVAGRRLILDGVDTEVIGVMPPNFEFAPLGRSIDVWSSRTYELNSLPPEQVPSATYLIAIARIRDGITRAQAQAEMAVLDAQYRAGNPGMADADPRLSISLNPVQELMVANVRTAIWVLFASVGVVLLIACANVASLLLSRALARRKEIAIRMALGASRGAIVGQLLAESVLLSLMAGALGVELAAAAQRAMLVIPPLTLPRLNPIQLDARVLGFTIAVSVLTGVLFGLAPALQFSRPDLQSVLRDEGRGSTGGRWSALARGALVALQVALSTVLLVGAGLLIRSFVTLQHVELGFDARNLLILNVSLAPSRYSSGSRVVGFADRVLAQVGGLPGVRAAAVSSALPLTPSRYGQMLPADGPEIPLAMRPSQPVEAVTPGYFSAMRVPLLRGRTFNEHDNESSTPVAVVNQAFARRYWPLGNAIGKRIFVGNTSTPMEVVGVVGDVKNILLTVDAVPELYYPLAQRPAQALNVIVRCASDPGRLAEAIRGRILAVDREQPVTGVESMEQYLGSSITRNRVTMFLLAVFSVTALIVATVGLYGLVAYSVAQRLQEFGIRLALGAVPANVLWLVIRQALVLGIVGIGVGLGASLALTRLMRSLLYHVSAMDFWTFTVSAVLFLAVTLAAGYVPARRAARLDPSDALRYE